MAKNTRIQDSGGQKYTPELRNEGYKTLQEQWTEAERLGNHWIKAGVSLAKTLISKRKDEHIDDWIPKDSPYWS